jgi:hypothetical protein
MEFELERTQLDRFDALLDTTLHQEETLEMIVPDACPDILGCMYWNPCHPKRCYPHHRCHYHLIKSILHP